MAFFVLVVHKFLKCFMRSSLQNPLSSGIYPSLKRLIRSQLIQGKCLPLTSVFVQVACLSITLRNSVWKKFHASSTKGIKWSLSQFMVVKFRIKSSVFKFLVYLPLIHLGIFHTQKMMEWSLRQSDKTPDFTILSGWVTRIQPNRLWSVVNSGGLSYEPS